MHVAEDVGLRSMWYQTAALPGNLHDLLLLPAHPQPKSVHHHRTVGVDTWIFLTVDTMSLGCWRVWIMVLLPSEIGHFSKIQSLFLPLT